MILIILFDPRKKKGKWNTIRRVRKLKLKTPMESNGKMQKEFSINFHYYIHTDKSKYIMSKRV